MHSQHRILQLVLLVVVAFGSKIDAFSSSPHCFSRSQLVRNKTIVQNVPKQDDDSPQRQEEEPTLDDLLDKPFFDPEAVSEDDPALIRWFADLVKNDYATAETLYAGALFVILVIVSQELLRMQIYGDGYRPFQHGVKPGQLF